MKIFLLTLISIAFLISAYSLTAQAQDEFPQLTITEEDQAEQKQPPPPPLSLTESIYRQLPKEDQERLIEEANEVFDYCSDRDLFAKFHDCRCVAAKFMDERIQNPDLSKNIIGVADRVAGACPNEPGTAGFAYHQCYTLYEHRMTLGLENFCVCYANSFAAFYKEDPRAFIPNITRISSASLLTCDKKGMASPFNPDR